MEKMFQSCCRNRVQREREREREKNVKKQREKNIKKQREKKEVFFFFWGRDMKPHNFFCNYLGRTLLL